MVALLLLHATNLPRLHSGTEMPAAFDSVNTALGPFRMPTLMVLSGMLLHRSLSKPLVEYYTRKVRTLLWPYLVWALILLSIQGELDTFLRPQQWIPVTYIWFLLFVFLYYCAAPLLRRVPAEIVVVIAVAGSALIADRGFISKFVLFAGYFALGHLISGQRPALLVLLRRSGAPLLALAVLLLVLPAAHGLVLSRLVTLTGVLGMIGVFARFYRPSRWTAPLEAVGRDSLIYYLSHYPFMIGATVLPAAVGVAWGPAHLVVCCAAAIAVGMVLARFRNSPAIGLLFAAPAPYLPAQPSDRFRV